MIGKVARVKMKRVLKNKWIHNVQQKLAENKVFTQDGREYDKTYISHVFNGRNSNVEIEKAIYEVYNEKLIEHSNINVIRKKILKKPLKTISQNNK